MNYTTKVFDDQSVDVEKWNALVDNAAAGVPFAYYEFNVASNDKTYYIIVPNESGDYLAGAACRIRGTLPVIGDFFASLWVDSSAMVRREVSQEKEVSRLKTAVYQGILALARKNHMVQAYLTHWSREEDQSLLQQLGFTVEENATFEIDLSPDLESIYQNIRNSNQRLIKQAKKNDTRTSFFRGTDALPALSSLQSLRQQTQKRAVSKNRHASMLLKSHNFLSDLLNKLQGGAIIGQSVNDEKVSASILLLATPEKAFYYIGGSDYQVVSKTRAANLLHWDGIQFLKKQGVKCYDLGGVPFNPSEDHPAYGVYRFKKSFGGELKVYFSGNYVVNKYKYFLFKKVLSNPGIKRLINKIFYVRNIRHHSV